MTTCTQTSLHLNHFSQLHYFTEQTVSFLPYIRFSEKLLSKFMTFRNRKMPSMGLSVALQTSIYFRIICSQSASDVLCTPISKLGHNLHTLQLFQNCLTVTYRYHLHVGPLICSFRIQKISSPKKHKVFSSYSCVLIASSVRLHSIHQPENTSKLRETEQ